MSHAKPDARTKGVAPDAVVSHKAAFGDSPVGGSSHAPAFGDGSDDGGSRSAHTPAFGDSPKACTGAPAFGAPPAGGRAGHSAFGDCDSPKLNSGAHHHAPLFGDDSPRASPADHWGGKHGISYENDLPNMMRTLSVDDTRKMGTAHAGHAAFGDDSEDGGPAFGDSTEIPPVSEHARPAPWLASSASKPPEPRASKPASSPPPAASSLPSSASASPPASSGRAPALGLVLDTSSANLHAALAPTPPPQESPSRVMNNLYLGSLEAVKNPRNIEQLNITHIVDVSGYNPQEPLLRRGVTYMSVEVQDDLEADMTEHFGPVSDFIDDALRNDHAVLVHCEKGVSRSPTLVMGYLMRVKHMSLLEAFRKVKEARSFVFPNLAFWSQLAHLEKHLFGKNSVAFRPDGLPELGEDGY